MSKVTVSEVRSRIGFGSAVFWLIVLAAAAWIGFGGSQFSLLTANLIIIYAIAALAQDWLIGHAGQISIGGAAFMAVGAFTTGAMNTAGVTNLGLTMLASLVAGAVLGLLVGLPASRLRGLYLLLTTLAFQYIVSFVAQEYQGHVAQGGLSVAPGNLFGVEFSNGRSAFFVFSGALAIVVFLLQGMYRRSPGRAWQSIRESEIAAGVVGVNVAQWKLSAFVGSSALTSLAGCFFAYYSGVVSYDTFSLELAISLIVMVFVGGTGTIAGPIVGSCFVGLVPYVLQRANAAIPSSSSTGQWLSTNESVIASGLYALAFLVVMLYEQKGLVAAVPRLGRAITRRVYGGCV